MSSSASDVFIPRAALNAFTPSFPILLPDHSSGMKKKDMSQERRLHKHLKESTVMDVLTFSASLNDVAPKSPMLFSMNHNTSELCTLSKYEKQMPNFLFQVLLELC